MRRAGRPSCQSRCAASLPSASRLLHATSAFRDAAATISSTEPASSAKKPRRHLRRLGIVLGLGGVIYLFDEFFNARTLRRNLLTGVTGVAIGLDYKFNFDPNSLESINGLHERCAERLLYVCEKNQGLYVKIGQAIGANSVILPKPYHALAKLFDDAEHMPAETIRKVIKRELGKDPEEVRNERELG